MDLFEVFDAINTIFPIAKRYAYGFNKDSQKLLYSYLSNR